MPLDQVCHGVAGAPAVHDLLGGVVGVDDVGPGDVPEIFALLQLLSWLAHLEQRQISEGGQQEISQKSENKIDMLMDDVDIPYLVLLGPVVDGVPVPGVGGCGAGGVGAPALLLHPGAAVGVNFPTHRKRGTHGEIRVFLLKQSFV